MQPQVGEDGVGNVRVAHIGGSYCRGRMKVR